jgi:S-adenosylmethionine uptake transporter
VVAVLLACGAPFFARVPDASLFAGIVGGAALATAALLILAWAYARAEANYLATSEYTAFLWASLLGFVVFGERVTSATLLGAVLIVGGCAWGARQRPTVMESPEAMP